MKKIFLAACIVASLTACNNTGTSDTTKETTDTTNRTMSTTGSYTPNEGDVTFRDKRLLIRNGDKWVPSDKEMTMGNGVIVYTNGTVKNGNQIDTLSDGEIVAHNGDLFDKSGNPILDAWSADKKEAK